MNNMALTLMDLKRFDEATAAMQDILRYTRDAWGPHSPITLSSIKNLASLYLRTDQPDRALQEIETVITWREDRKSTRLNSSHVAISYAVLCLKKKKKCRDNAR